MKIVNQNWQTNLKSNHNITNYKTKVKLVKASLPDSYPLIQCYFLRKGVDLPFMTHTVDQIFSGTNWEHIHTRQV